ncbi:hypothetical protein HNR42_000869 [Deinobacterium chartae]|uniref:Uncharacterized protein n=1 Tax=Deinobacterium chartae TaxID=521158 RepID=A0A841I002_9DEIO|nr:hypothetical protein [Deinobacterium chartae]MBB6097452.1 hypothetical protein [Deinobacterium chartae]
MANRNRRSKHKTKLETVSEGLEVAEYAAKLLELLWMVISWPFRIVFALLRGLFD